jgi:hypothetical protein
MCNKAGRNKRIYSDKIGDVPDMDNIKPFPKIFPDCDKYEMISGNNFFICTKCGYVLEL